MKNSLQLKLSQHLTLTPQLQQSIRLLQLSTLELNQELETILQENPLLERADNDAFSAGGGEESYASDSGTGTAPEGTSERSESPVAEPETDGDSMFSGDWGEGYGGGDDDEDSDYPQIPAHSVSLRDHLNGQINLTPLPERDRRLVALLVDTLDEAGYLTISLDELRAMLPAELGVEPEEISIALRHLQNLEPAGVGARNLSECLELQLRALPATTPYRETAIALVRNCLVSLANRDYTRLKKLLNCDDDTLRGVQALIRCLNPRPGTAFGGSEARYITPDVTVKKVKGLWVVSLNQDAMPKLRVNRMYADILKRNRNGSGQQLASQLQEAKWLIKNVMQRFDTILRVSQCIVDRQRHFFEHGEVAMRPLILREVAETVGLHESTVSRVTTQKFMLTPRGIFELKYFFGSHVATDTGGACSATAIRALIKQLVSAEDAKKPLSDNQISDILAKQGIVVARRTIAKYRESLQIPPANLRKSL